MFRNSILMFVVAFTAFASHTQASVLNEWNLIVRNSVTSSSEVDGSTLIGGNLTGTSNYAVQGITASTGDGLAIAGNINGGINVQINNGGNLRIAGSVLGGSNINLNGGGAMINDPSVPTMVSNAFNELEALSTALSGLASNGTLDGAGNMNAIPSLMSGQNVAVYNLASVDFQSLGQLNLNFGAADTVIINVLANGSGVVDFIAPPNIIGGFNQSNSSRILWNLPDAATVLMNNSFNGALLAPLADLQLLGGGMNGSVAVDSISVMNAEIRRHTYTGFIPEPTTLGLLCVAGAVFVSRRRRA